MQLRKKINYRKFFLLSLLSSTLIFWATGLTLESFLANIILCIATVANLYLLVLSLEMILTPEGEKIKNYKKKVLTYTLSKIGILLLGLGLGIHFIGDKIILPVINYVLLIFWLTLSVKRD